jgi:hypothetical protein
MSHEDWNKKNLNLKKLSWKNKWNSVWEKKEIVNKFKSANTNSCIKLTLYRNYKLIKKIYNARPHILAVLVELTI